MKNRIKLLRKSLKLSQTDFANSLGLTMRAIQKWEAGSVEVKLSSLKLLEQVFNINIDWLINGKGEMFLSENENSKNEIIIKKIENKLSEKFLKLAYQLTSNEIIKVEGYMEALIDSRKIKEEQKLSS